MVNIIVELSKYVILTLMIIYTFYCFYLAYRQRSTDQEPIFKQFILIFLIDTVSFGVIWLKTRDFQVLFLYIEMMAFFSAYQILYRLLYRRASLLLINTMCMLLSVGFIMLTRLDISAAMKQLVIAAAGSGVSLIIPVAIRRMKFLKRLGWLYACIGILMLGAVLFLAQTSYGAKLSLWGIQPSEVIKLTFVFFMAAVLYKDVTFAKAAAATLAAALHVGILVFSRYLGSAVIFFTAYLVMIYVSTRHLWLFFLGIAGGAGASVAAYFLFGHVRERVSAFIDPMAVYEKEGYQIVQSLFAIGTGGWFGMGLCQGSPEKIPVVKNDFIFSAICEELGGIFGICLILICMTFFLIIINLSLKIRNPFYKLIALGLGTEYAVQVFLTIGGVTKFIPMTGVTLPLVAYGGTSVISTIMMLSIIQGLYILREDEDEEVERIRREDPFGSGDGYGRY